MLDPSSLMPPGSRGAASIEWRIGRRGVSTSQAPAGEERVIVIVIVIAET
ncbi:hypothetical protein [Microbacterium sp. NPDC076911]